MLLRLLLFWLFLKLFCVPQYCICLIHFLCCFVVVYGPYLRSGVTFDTGGVSIKPAANMALMRGDMGGAACVVSSLLGLAELNVRRSVVALVPLCENMVSGCAVKPGDVVTAMNGKTIEVRDDIYVHTADAAVLSRDGYLDIILCWYSCLHFVKLSWPSPCLCCDVCFMGAVPGGTHK